MSRQVDKNVFIQLDEQIAEVSRSSAERIGIEIADHVRNNFFGRVS